jgi:hypothetical protein
MDKQTPILKSQAAQRISAGPASKVWTPSDFLDLGQRDAVDRRNGSEGGQCKAQKNARRSKGRPGQRRSCFRFEYLTVWDAKLDSGIAREY